MDAFICTACGTQYPPSAAPPPQCTICEEERQYVPPRGQTWTTPAALAAGHFNSYREHEPGMIGIGTQPHLPSASARCLCARRRKRPVGLHRNAGCCDVALINGLGGLKASAFRIRTSTRAWWNGAGRSAASRSLCMPPTKRWIMRPGPAGQAMGRRDTRCSARRDARALRRPFSWRDRAALVQGSGRAAASCARRTLRR